MKKEPTKKPLIDKKEFKPVVQNSVELPKAKFEGAENAKTIAEPKKENKMLSSLKNLKNSVSEAPETKVPDLRTKMEQFTPSRVDPAKFGDVNTIKPINDDYAARLKALKELMGI